MLPPTRPAADETRDDDLRRQRGAGIRAHLAAALFPEPFALTASGGTRAALLAMLFLAGTALSLARTPRSHWNILWAEDGAVFASGALNDSWRSLIEPYSGYFHFVPRVAALSVSWAPLEVLPAAITLTAAMITSVSGLFCFIMLEARIAALPLRLAAWASCIALPTMGGDVANNLANLHWYLLIAGFCALVTAARSRGYAAAQCAAVFAAVASDVLGLLLIPLFAVRWWLLPARRDRAVSLAAAAAAAMQAAAVVAGLLSASREIGAVHPGALEFAQMYAVRVALVVTTGPSLAQAVWNSSGILAGWAVLVGVVAFLGTMAWRDERRRWGIVLFATGSVLSAAVVYYVQWYAISMAPVGEVLTGMRYAVVPAALLMIALLIAVDALLARSTRGAARTAGALVAMALVFAPIFADLRASTPRSDHWVWPDTLAAGRAWCAEGRSPQDLANLGISPGFFGGMLVRCDVLTPR